MGSVRKGLPPFARIAKPSGNGLHLFVGSDSFRSARMFNSRGGAALAFTGDEAASSIHWPVKGFEITLVNSGLPDDVIEPLVYELLAAGSGLVVVTGNEGGGVSVHRQTKAPEVSHAGR